MLIFFGKQFLEIEGFDDVNATDGILGDGIRPSEMLHLFSRMGLHWLDDLVVQIAETGMRIQVARSSFQLI